MRSFQGLTAYRRFLRKRGYRKRGRALQGGIQRASRIRRLKRGLRRAPLPDAGQSTVEFAVVTAAFLALCLALGVMWHGISDGMFVEHALSSASHHVQSISPQAAADVLLY